MRYQAVNALSAVGSPAVPYLEQALGDDNPQMRIGALEACGSGNPKDRGRGFSSEDDKLLLPRILDSMRDKDAGVRVVAVHSLPWVCSGENEEARGVGALCDVLDDESPAVRKATAQALRWLATFAKNRASLTYAIPGLLKRLKDDDPSVRREAACALGNMGNAAAMALPQLRELAGSEKDDSTLRELELAIKYISEE